MNNPWMWRAASAAACAALLVGCSTGASEQKKKIDALEQQVDILQAQEDRLQASLDKANKTLKELQEERRAIEARRVPEGARRAELPTCQDATTSLRQSLPAGTLRALVDNVEETSMQARLVPHFRGGQPEGMKVFGIKPNTVVAGLGLQNGDVVIRVAGHTLNGTQQAIGAFKAIQNNPVAPIKIVLLRDGEAICLELDEQAP